VPLDVEVGVHEEATILQKSAALTLRKCDKADLAAFVFSGLNVEGATLGDLGY
jgi:hypothetical protein